MGYGPLVRASTGVTRLWTSPDAAPGTFYDATTIFPDHVVARLTAVATLAVLIRRRQSGVGAHVHISQAEAAINQLAQAYITESCRSAGHLVVDDDAVHTVLPCAGNDEWCVISLQSASQRVALADLIGRNRRLPEDRTELIDVLSQWTAGQDKTELSERLQRRGVPAGPMQRASDVLEDPQLVFRQLFTEMTHPLLPAPLPSETAPAPYVGIARAALRPAPMPGEHTLEICRTTLGLSKEHIDGLIAEGVLFADMTTSEKGTLHAP
jgi:crotonobetainyl-CoA:carnitine CoA-transferase CaiB-like acyl-CoA transferase